MDFKEYKWSLYTRCFWLWIWTGGGPLNTRYTIHDNSARYIETIKKNVRQRVCRVGGGVNIADFVAAWQCKTAHCSGDAEVLSHPPYSPDLAPSDFHFFPHLKRDLKGTHCTSDDEVKQAVTSWIKQRTTEFFIDGTRKLVLRWEKCIERQGDYVEK